MSRGSPQYFSGLGSCCPTMQRSVRRLGFAIFFLGIVTTLNNTWVKVYRASRSRPHSLGPPLPSPTNHCAALCEQCAGPAAFQALYDGFPLEYDAPSGIPHWLTAPRPSAPALSILAISDACDAFAAPLWERLVQAGHTVTALCASATSPPLAAGAILIRVCPANECDTPAAFAAWALAQAAAVKPSATLLLPSLPSFPLSSFASVTGPLVTILPSLAYDDFVAYAQLETLAGVAPGAPEPVKALGQAYINKERVLVLETAWPGEERVLRGDRPVLPSSSSLIVALLFEPSGNAVSQRHQKSLLTQMLTGITRLLGEEVVIALACGKGMCDALASPSVRAYAVEEGDAVLASADVYVDIDVLAVGTRHRMLQALALGIPVIVPDTGGVASYSSPAILTYQPGDVAAVAAHMRAVRVMGDEVASAARAYVHTHAHADTVVATLENAMYAVAALQ